MKVYITIAGMDYRHGTSFIVPQMIGSLKMKLIKEPDNEYDQEAIMAKVPGLGKVGYVANSVRTVGEDCYSAGRLYDKIGDTAECTVEFVLDDSRAICSLEVE